MKKYIHVFLLFFFVKNSYAQESSNTITIKTSLSAAATYTGLNSYLLISAQLGNHEIYGGPKLAMSKSYLPFNDVWGFDFGYNYYLLHQKHWAGLVNLDYQGIFFSPYTLPSQDASGKNVIHEFLFSLGLTYYPGRKQRLGILLNCGTGMFLEHFHDLVEEEKSTNTGRAEIVRLGISYKIFGK